MRPWDPEPRCTRWPGGPGGVQKSAAEATLRWTRSSAGCLVMLTAPEALHALGGHRSPESADGRGALVAQLVARSIAFLPSGCPRADPPGHRHRRNGLGQPPAQPERCPVHGVFQHHHPVRDLALPVLLPRPPRGPLQVQPLRRTRGELLLVSLPPHATQGCRSPLWVIRALRKSRDRFRRGMAPVRSSRLDRGHEQRARGLPGRPAPYEKKHRGGASSIGEERAASQRTEQGLATPARPAQETLPSSSVSASEGRTFAWDSTVALAFWRICTRVRSAVATA